MQGDFSCNPVSTLSIDATQLNKNCCHFSNCLCQSLNVGNVPDRVLTLPNAGASVMRWAESVRDSFSHFAVAALGSQACPRCTWRRFAPMGHAASSGTGF